MPFSGWFMSTNGKCRDARIRVATGMLHQIKSFLIQCPLTTQSVSTGRANMSCNMEVASA